MALRTVVLALLCLTPNARMSKAHKKSKELKEKEKLAEQKRIVERLYYAPYKYYGRPLHLLTDVEWGNLNEDRESRGACALPTNVPGDPKFYLFSYLRDDSPGLLAHFLRWYGAAGIDFYEVVLSSMGSKLHQVVRRTPREPQKSSRIIGYLSPR